MVSSRTRKRYEAYWKEQFPSEDELDSTQMPESSCAAEASDSDNETPRARSCGQMHKCCADTPSNSYLLNTDGLFPSSSESGNTLHDQNQGPDPQDHQEPETPTHSIVSATDFIKGPNTRRNVQTRFGLRQSTSDHNAKAPVVGEETTRGELTTKRRRTTFEKMPEHVNPYLNMLVMELRHGLQDTSKIIQQSVARTFFTAQEAEERARLLREDVGNVWRPLAAVRVWERDRGPRLDERSLRRRLHLYAPQEVYSARFQFHSKFGSDPTLVVHAFAVGEVYNDYDRKRTVRGNSVANCTASRLKGKQATNFVRKWFASHVACAVRDGALPGPVGHYQVKMKVRGGNMSESVVVRVEDFVKIYCT